MLNRLPLNEKIAVLEYSTRNNTYQVLTLTIKDDYLQQLDAILKNYNIKRIKIVFTDCVAYTGQLEWSNNFLTDKKLYCSVVYSQVGSNTVSDFEFYLDYKRG